LLFKLAIRDGSQRLQARFIGEFSLSFFFAVRLRYSSISERITSAIVTPSTAH
jgi:hypothetical protein